MRKLTASETKVLDRLIFPETFEMIMEETELQYGELRDDLINLMSYRLIEVIDTEPSETRHTPFYDTDNLRETVFQITKSGQKQLSKAK